MLLIKTMLGLSSKQGIGLFAAEFIPKGTVTWKYEPIFDTAFTEEQINIMCNSAREKFFEYAYFDTELDKYVLCFDDLRFINHDAKNPNICSTTKQDVAARDIAIGEELFCNYTHFEENYFIRRGIDESIFV